MSVDCRRSGLGGWESPNAVPNFSELVPLTQGLLPAAVAQAFAIPELEGHSSEPLTQRDPSRGTQPCSGSGQRSDREQPLNNPSVRPVESSSDGGNTGTTDAAFLPTFGGPQQNQQQHQHSQQPYVPPSTRWNQSRDGSAQQNGFPAQSFHVPSMGPQMPQQLHQGLGHSFNPAMSAVPYGSHGVPTIQHLPQPSTSHNSGGMYGSHGPAYMPYFFQDVSSIYNMPHMHGAYGYRPGYPDYSGMSSGHRQQHMPAATENTTEFDDNDNTARAVKRPRLVWTPQLHKKFEEAVNKLGSDKAIPKNIMQEMNVEGLTRENVASHLQKYRLQRKKETSSEEVEHGHDPGMGLREPGMDPQQHGDQQEGSIRGNDWGHLQGGTGGGAGGGGGN